MVRFMSFCLDAFLNLTPLAFPWRLPTFPLQLCVYNIMKNRFSRKEMKGFVSRRARERKRGDQRTSVEVDNRPVSLHHHPTARQPSQGCINPHAGHITACLHQCLLAC